MESLLLNEWKKRWFGELKQYNNDPHFINNICRHENLTMQIILDNPDFPWDWRAISDNEQITMNDVMDNPNLPWDYHNLSGNPSITIDFIKKNPDKDWNWKTISRCAKIDFNSFDYSLPFNYVHLSDNPNLTIDFVKWNLDKPWCWLSLTQNKNITKKDILNNPSLPWKYTWRKFTIDEILAHPNIKYDFSYTDSLCRVLHDYDFAEALKIKHLGYSMKFFGYCSTKSNLETTVLSQITQILLLTMLEHNEKEFAHNDMQFVFADNYMVKMICQFL